MAKKVGCVQQEVVVMARHVNAGVYNNAMLYLLRAARCCAGAVPRGWGREERLKGEIRAAAVAGKNRERFMRNVRKQRLVCI